MSNKRQSCELGDFGLTLTSNDKKSIILSKDGGTFYYYSPEKIDETKYDMIHGFIMCWRKPI